MLMLCIYGSCLVWYIKSSATLSWKENLFCLLISGRTENPGISERAAFLCDLTDNNRRSMDWVPAISAILKSMFLCNKKYVKQISSHLWKDFKWTPKLTCSNLLTGLKIHNKTTFLSSTNFIFSSHFTKHIT